MNQEAKPALLPSATTPSRCAAVPYGSGASAAGSADPLTAPDIIPQNLASCTLSAPFGAVHIGAPRLGPAAAR